VQFKRGPDDSRADVDFFIEKTLESRMARGQFCKGVFVSIGKYIKACTYIGTVV
jgi:hypothetical protein